jgi:uncharacterized integral membrane protein
MMMMMMMMMMIIIIIIIIIIITNTLEVGLQLTYWFGELSKSSVSIPHRVVYM